MNAGKVWSDMTIMQELEEQMSGSSTTLGNSRGVNQRGPESYPLPALRNNSLIQKEEQKEIKAKINQVRKFFLLNFKTIIFRVT